MDLAVRQLPDQPAIDRAEQVVAAAQSVGDGRAMAEQPFELAGRECGVKVEARLSADEGKRALVAQLLEFRVAAAALPDDGGHDGLAGMTVPDDESLGLIGDAEAGDLGAAGGGQHLAHALHDVGQHLLGILLDPAGLRRLCRERAGSRVKQTAGSVDGDGLRVGRALIGADEDGHGKVNTDKVLVARLQRAFVPVFIPSDPCSSVHPPWLCGSKLTDSR
jgi:hypothetical protein